jgi:hypothetical protein
LQPGSNQKGTKKGIQENQAAPAGSPLFFDPISTCARHPHANPTVRAFAIKRAFPCLSAARLAFFVGGRVRPDDSTAYRTSASRPSSGNGATPRTASWWHRRHDTASADAISSLLAQSHGDDRLIEASHDSLPLWARIQQAMDRRAANLESLGNIGRPEPSRLQFSHPRCIYRGGAALCRPLPRPCVADHRRKKATERHREDDAARQARSQHFLITKNPSVDHQSGQRWSACAFLRASSPRSMPGSTSRTIPQPSRPEALRRFAQIRPSCRITMRSA